MSESTPQDACGHGPDIEQEDRLQRALDQIRFKLLVMSGKGGVGKSTVAAYLALGLAARGYAVGLLDVDLHGPSIPRMLGLSGHAQVQEQQQRITPMVTRHGLKVLSVEMLMPDRESSVIWRGPLKIGVIKQFISDVEWGPLDFLVIDSPPGTGDEPLTVAQSVDGALAVVVTTPQEIALADVRKSLDFCRQVQMPVLGLVENMSGLTCPHCGQTVELLGQGGGQELAQRLGLSLLARLPWDGRLVRAGDSGQPLDLEQDYNAAGPSCRELVQAVLARTAQRS
ncbi:MAG: ATP-binding protein [Desulfarculus sp.]|nr:MAG: ATP-binding protein [Desulfarculus sp.]